jgi:hypothetical protein
MLKRYLLLLLVLVVTACSSRQTQTPEAQPTSPPATSVPASNTERLAGCTAESPRPTPGPTEQSVFPFAGPSDWVQGPETAAITVFEYSDFQ